MNINKPMLCLGLILMALGVWELREDYRSFPDVAGYYWGSRIAVSVDLYSNDGREFGSLIETFLGDPAQVCIYTGADADDHCRYFHSNSEAIQYLVARAIAAPSRFNRCTDDDWKTSWPARIVDGGVQCWIVDKSK